MNLRIEKLDRIATKGLKLVGVGLVFLAIYVTGYYQGRVQLYSTLSIDEQHRIEQAEAAALRKMFEGETK